MFRLPSLDGSFVLSEKSDEDVEMAMPAVLVLTGMGKLWLENLCVTLYDSLRKVDSMKGAMRQLMIIALVSCSVNAFWSEKTHSQKPEYSLSDKDDVHEIRTA